MAKQIIRTTSVSAAICIALVCPFVLRAAGVNSAKVQGVVKDATGAPVSGAFVKLKNAQRRLTFMVITQDQGRYTMNHLPAGKYVVQAIGNGFQSEWSAPVDLAAGGKAAVDLQLTSPQAALLPAGWPGRPGMAGGGEGEGMGGAPPPPFPDGDGKQLVETKCAQCHATRQIATAVYNHDGWQKTVQEMRDYIHATTYAKDLTDQEANTVVEYLAANFSGAGPGGRARRKPDSNSRLPHTLLSGEATKYIAVEFELPTPDSGPHEITVDNRGNGWVSERSGCCVGKLDLNTLLFTEYHPPAAASARLHLNAIVRGLGDQLWLVDGGPNRRWLEVDSKTGEFNSFQVPKAQMGSASGNTMRVLPDGTVWLNAITSNQVQGFDPKTNKFVAYDVPEGVKEGKNATPYGMAISGDGKIWFVENSFNKIGRLDPDTGNIREFDVPVKGAVPRKMGSDSEGNIWVGLHLPGKLMKVDYKTFQMTVYSPPTENAGVYSVCGDPTSKMIWFSEQQVDKIARFNPETKEFVEFPLISPESDPRRIEVDPHDPNRIWWSGDTSNKMGYIEILNGNTKHM